MKILSLIPLLSFNADCKQLENIDPLEAENSEMIAQKQFRVCPIFGPLDNFCQYLLNDASQTLENPA